MNMLLDEFKLICDLTNLRIIDMLGLKRGRKEGMDEPTETIIMMCLNEQKKGLHFQMWNYHRATPMATGT